MIMRFITINGRILDFEKYRSDVASLRYELVYELNEIAAKYGFEQSNKTLKGFSELSLKSLNRHLNLVLSINLKRKI